MGISYGYFLPKGDFLMGISNGYFFLIEIIVGFLTTYGLKKMRPSFVSDVLEKMVVSLKVV